MWTSLKKLWNDEAAFKQAGRDALRWGGVLVGILIQFDIIPTFIDGGAKYGVVVAALGQLLSSRSAGNIEAIVATQVQTSALTPQAKAAEKAAEVAALPAKPKGGS